MFAREKVMIKLGVKNILVNWRHSLSTLMAVGVGFCAVSLFDGFILHLKDFTAESYINRGMLGDVVVQKKLRRNQAEGDPWMATIDKKEQAVLEELIRSDPRVAVRARYLYVSGVMSGAKASPIFAGMAYDVAEADQIRGAKWTWNTVAGRPLAQNDLEGMHVAIGLGKQLGCTFQTQGTTRPDGAYIASERPFNCTANSVQLSVTTQNSQINAATFKIVGLLDLMLRDVNDVFISMPLTAAQKLFDTENIGRISILLKDQKDSAAFISDLQAKIDAKHVDVLVRPWIDTVDASAARGGTEILRIFRALFLSTVAVVAAMSVANSMMKSVNERIREIGTLRSLGFRRADIVIMFVAEGFFLGFLSCFVGLVATSLIAQGMSMMGLTFSAGILSGAMPLMVKLNFQTWLMTLFLLAGICGLTSWIIVRRVSRMVVADTLRHVA